MVKSLALSTYLVLKGLGWGGTAAREGRAKSGPRGAQSPQAPAAHPWPDRPEGPLAWFHVPGDDSLNAVEELVTRFVQVHDRANILITAPIVPTTAQTTARDVRVSYAQVPDETPGAVAAFLDHWRPDTCLWARGHLRPVLISGLTDRSTPMLLIDAALSGIEQRWLPGISRGLLSSFRHLLAVDNGVAARLRSLGALPGTVETSGPLEEGTAALPYDEAERAFLAEGLGARPMWLATSLAKSEISAVLTAHRRAQRRSHRLLLIVEPSSPEVTRALIEAAAEQDLDVATRATDDEPSEETELFIADVPHEMGLWYRLAPISYMGGTLTGQGCRNPFEPAALGSAVLHGPNIKKFRGSYQRLSSAGGTRLILRTLDLGEAVGALLSPDASAKLAHAAWDVSSAGAEVTDRVITLLTEALDTAPAHAGTS